MIQDYLEKIRKTLNVVYLKAVIYARYSSDMQRGESIDAQIRLIKEFAQANNIVIVGEYIDEAQSAKRDNRESFQKLMSDAKIQPDWNLILVHKLDRFARNRTDSAIYRVELRKSRKYIISTTEQFDDSPESIMLEAMIEAMAEYYSKNLAREVMKGLTENAVNGRHCGGVPPLGYDVKDSIYFINEFEAQAVQLIYSEFLDGASYSEIIAELNECGYKTKRGALFTKNSLYEILRNEKYTGTFVYNRMESRDSFTGNRSRHRYKSDDEIIKVEDAIPAIISKKEFVKVQTILNKRKRAYTNHAKEIYLLTGKIKCGKCGGSYVGTRNFNSRGVKYVAYKCNINQRSVHKRCNNKCIARDWLETYVLEAIDNYIMQFDDERLDNLYQTYAKEASKSKTAEIEVLNKEIANIDKQLNRISEVISITSAPSLIEKLMSLEQQKANIATQIRDMTYDKNMILSKLELKFLIEKAKQMLKEKSIPKIREMIDLVVKEIIVNEEDVIVYLNFSNNNILEQKYYTPRKVSCVGRNGTPLEEPKD